MIKKDVQKTAQGVAINFSGAIAKETVFSMVENCQTGQCECMNEETKQKVKDMIVSGEDGLVNLELKGDITQEEIEKALEKSKLLS